MTAEPAALPAPSPSDRRDCPPSTGVGFDTVRLIGPAAPTLLTELDEVRVRRRADLSTGELTEETRSGAASVRVGETNARVLVYCRGSGLQAALELSGPAMQQGHNFDALGLDLLPSVIEEALAEAASQFASFPAPSHMRVVRLDLVRDFVGVPCPTDVLTSLSRLPTAGRFQQQTYSRAEDPGKIQSLYRSVPERWMTRGYDKVHQSRQSRRRSTPRGPASPRVDLSASRLRWELELNHRVLQELRQDERDPLQAAPELLIDLAAYYFHHSEFDRTFQGGSTMLKALLTDLAQTPQGRREAARLAAYVEGVRSGVPLLSHNTVDLARATLRRHRLSLADLLSPDGEPSRLDFSSGRLETGDPSSHTPSVHALSTPER